LHDFQGKLLHTAQWDNSVDLTGKHVGLIGNGSSGIQVLPAIQPHVKHVTTFVREPTWVSPVQGMDQHKYTEEEKKGFAETPGALLAYRKELEYSMNAGYDLFLKGSPLNATTEAYMKDQMKQKIGNEDLASKLIPEWSVGCRRLTPGIGYLGE
jgi:cation diffusion facilitator CzcD-associated flavoprotein CzcO